MTFPKARLAVAACLFVGWLGYLGFLVYHSRNQVILSRPQFLTAQLILVVEVRDDGGKPDADVTFVKVLWPSEKAGEGPDKLHLADLPACDRKHGYVGPGKYLVPLVRSIDRPGVRIAPVPLPPGVQEARIYAWTPDAQAQVERLIAARK